MDAVRDISSGDKGKRASQFSTVGCQSAVTRCSDPRIGWAREVKSIVVLKVL
jgi:hypothetical protein